MSDFAGLGAARVPAAHDPLSAWRQGVFVSVGLQDFVAGHLDKLRGTDVDGVTFEGPVDNVDVDSAAVVLFRAALGSGREVLQGHDWCTEVLTAPSLTFSSPAALTLRLCERKNNSFLISIC